MESPFHGDLDASARAHAELGALAAEADDRFARAYVLAHYLHRFADAERTLAERAAVLGAQPPLAAKLAYYRAVAAVSAGDHRRALALVEDARARAKDVREPAFTDDVEELAAWVRALAGAPHEAYEAFLALDARRGEATPPCARATRLTTAGVTGLAALEAGLRLAPGAPSPVSTLRRAVSITTSTCADDYRRANVWLELSRAAVLEGALAEARLALVASRAQEASRAPPIEQASREVEITLLLREGHPSRARALAEAHVATLAREDDPAVAWSAWLALARARRAAGDARAAIDAYREAERALSQAAMMVPLGEGRGVVPVLRRASADEWIALLREQSRDREAYAVALAAASRMERSARAAEHLSSLSGAARVRWQDARAAYLAERDRVDEEAQGDWRLAADAAGARAGRTTRLALARAALESALATVGSTALDPPSPPTADVRTLTLLLRPAPGELIVFAERGRSLRVLSLAPAPASAGLDQRASALFPPLRGDLDAVERVRVMVERSAHEWPVHELPYEGRPLQLVKPTVYSAGGAAVPIHGRGALVVSDPSGTLPGSRAEGRRVAAALEGELAPVEHATQLAATPQRVRQRLPEVFAFHFAGHATSAGSDGWGSTLGLADGAHLAVADVLALPAVPPFVFLDACTAGELTSSSGEERLHVGRAFVAAGAHVVIAPSRVVRDELGLALATEFYAAWDRALEHAPDALAEAARRVLVRDPSADVGAYRVLVP